jgi:hypothetical protein
MNNIVVFSIPETVKYLEKLLVADIEDGFLEKEELNAIENAILYLNQYDHLQNIRKSDFKITR